MPTFTALALDRLIEPGASITIGYNGSESKLERRNSTNSNSQRGTSCPPKPERTNSASSSMTSAKKHHWPWMSPALYTTPESTPLPDSPSSFPPSPYIINHKRRGPRLKSSSHNDSDDDDIHRRDMDEEEKGDEENTKKGEREEEGVDLNEDDGLEETGGVNVVSVGVNESGSGGQNRPLKVVTFDLERENEAEDFYDFQDSTSVKSSNEGESMSALERTLNTVTPMAEFYDAWEELSSESGPQLLHDIEVELREMQLSLLTEMEKRKKAEASLNSMRTQWTRISQHLSAVGLALPPDPTAVVMNHHEQEQVVVDPAEELCCQIDIARYVSNAIGRGIAKAEIEQDMETQIESMNFEIARLMDRLHYYEAVNREMSQRNQEVVETARRLRQSRKRRQSWVWGSIATAITLGTAALAWSYLPSGNSSPSVSQSRAPETDHSSSK